MTNLMTRRVQLMTRLRELDRRLHDIEDQLDDPRTPDWEDAATEREGDEVLQQLGTQGEAEIRRIQAALVRLRNGQYGVCVVCDAPIAEARLDLLPDTPFCSTCAQAH